MARKFLLTLPFPPLLPEFSAKSARWDGKRVNEGGRWSKEKRKKKQLGKREDSPCMIMRGNLAACGKDRGGICTEKEKRVPSRMRVGKNRTGARRLCSGKRLQELSRSTVRSWASGDSYFASLCVCEFLLLDLLSRSYHSFSVCNSLRTAHATKGGRYHEHTPRSPPLSLRENIPLASSLNAHIQRRAYPPSWGLN